MAYVRTVFPLIYPSTRIQVYICTRIILYLSAGQSPFRITKRLYESLCSKRHTFTVRAYCNSQVVHSESTTARCESWAHEQIPYTCTSVYTHCTSVCTVKCTCIRSVNCVNVSLLLSVIISVHNFICAHNNLHNVPNNLKKTITSLFLKTWQIMQQAFTILSYMVYILTYILYVCILMYFGYIYYTNNIIYLLYIHVLFIFYSIHMSLYTLY